MSPSPTLTWPLLATFSGAVLLTAGVRNRSIADVMKGVTDPQAGAGDTGFSSTLLQPSRALLTGNTSNGKSGNTGGVSAPSSAAAVAALARVRVSPTPGSPHWAGSGDVLHQFVVPFMKRQGLSAGSEKRSPAQNAAVGGASGSDHLSTNTTTDAIDFPTTNGEGAARALAAAMGSKSWAANSYNRFPIKVGRYTFSVQILWGAAIDHADHVHVGVARG